MDTAKATLSNFRQSPRKMRLVANLVRGKKVSDVLVNLEFVNKKASLPVRNLIKSAFDNAKSLGMDTENLIIKSIAVNAGKTLQRRLPAARGSAHPIHKRTSHIFVELAYNDKKKDKKIRVEKEEVKKVEKIEKKPVKKSKK